MLTDFDSFLDTFGETASLPENVRALCVREFIAGREYQFALWQDRDKTPDDVPSHVREEYARFIALRKAA